MMTFKQGKKVLGNKNFMMYTYRIYARLQWRENQVDYTLEAVDTTSHYKTWWHGKDSARTRPKRRENYVNLTINRSVFWDATATSRESPVQGKSFIKRAYSKPMNG